MAAGWRCPAAGSVLTLLLSLGASGPALLRGGGGTGGTPETPLRAGEGEGERAGPPPAPAAAGSGAAGLWGGP